MLWTLKRKWLANWSQPALPATTSLLTEQREEIKYIVRRVIYADFNVTPALVMLALERVGYEVSRTLAQYYVAQVKKEDAEAERIRAEMPDLVQLRAGLRKHREAVFNAAMGDKQLAQANRALDALAALDGVAVAKTTVSVEGKDGGPVQVEDVTQNVRFGPASESGGGTAARQAEALDADSGRD